MTRSDLIRNAAPPRITKVAWSGLVQSVQPRIRLSRSFDERSHSYLGYVLRISGELGGEAREFAVGIGKAAHSKHQIRVGDSITGKGVPVNDPRTELADLYRVSALKVVERIAQSASDRPPLIDLAPTLEVYRERGHRRLATRQYPGPCATCKWGCKMAVELIPDHWNPTRKRYRTETFCYGPKSCAHYVAGPTRKVPGRKQGMSWEEADWIDEEATSHRGPDD